MGLCSGHGNSVVIRELSLYPQPLLAKLTVYTSIKTDVKPSYFITGVFTSSMSMHATSLCYNIIFIPLHNDRVWPPNGLFLADNYC